MFTVLQSAPNTGATFMTDKDDLLTTSEAAEIIGVTQRQVQWLCSQDLLPYQQIGRRVKLIRRSDAEYYRDNRPAKGARRPTK